MTIGERKSERLSSHQTSTTDKKGYLTVTSSTDTCSDGTFEKVQSGLEFLLSHFREPLFPRKVSTAATKNAQKPAQNIADAMKCFQQEGSWLDCRIAAFGIEQTNPDLIFIDLDDKDFCRPRAIRMALTRILKRIKKKLGGHPAVSRSGRGYHIIQPIDCPVNLNNIKEFAALTENPNNKYLQFAERYLTGNKNDGGHHPALRSSMIRVPGSLNSECKAAGVDAEVKIIQKWDGHRPDYRLLIGSFFADLVRHQQKIIQTIGNKKGSSCIQNNTPLKVPWIEKLLQTSIEDYRKHARDLIIIPYLVVCRGLKDKDQIYEIVMKWADGCAELRKLDPSRCKFAARVRSRIDEVMHDGIPPMKWQTLKERNPWLCERLKPDGFD